MSTSTVAGPSVPEGALGFVATFTGSGGTHPTYSARSDDYVRRYWTPVLGPTSYVLVLAVLDGIVEHTVGTAKPWLVDARHLAKRCGVAPRQLPRVLDRLCSFGPVRELEPRFYGVPWTWPDLPPQFLKRLHPVLRVEHDDLMEGTTCCHCDYRYRDWQDGKIECVECGRLLPDEWVLAKELNP